MKNINWRYPKTLNEAAELVRHPNTVIHSGGTALIDRKLTDNTMMLDLFKLGLTDIRIQNGEIEAGAMCSYSQLIKALKKISSQSLLLKSLSPAANTPLRNRITLGGSIAFFPPWSDLIGPLLALQARVSLIGSAEGIFPIKDYLHSRQLRQGTLIKSVIWNETGIIGDHYREVRTRSDMPLFTITAAIKRENGLISSASVYIVGVHEKYQSLSALEDWLKGKSHHNLQENAIANQITLRFGGHRINDSLYMAEKAAIQTERLIFNLVKEQ
jgi:CO/xanthine dehydrogenase FAD-binding subunit